MIHVDGSQLEGGGQILRNAVALSSILQKPIRITKIRAGRDKPGLRPQHLTGLQIAEKLTQGKLTNGAVGSTEIDFEPGDRSSSVHEVTGSTGTAGSCTLLAQVSLPIALFSGSGAGPIRLKLEGGTDADMAPPVGYLQHVLLPVLRSQLHLPDHAMELDLRRRGFFPKGGGQVHLQIQPLRNKLQPLKLDDFGEITRVYISAFVAGNKLKREDAQKAVTAARKVLTGGDLLAGSSRVEIEEDVQVLDRGEAVGDGGGFLLTVTTSTGCVLGAAEPLKRGEKLEVTAENAAKALVGNSLKVRACVDEYLQDQLIVFCALADGESRLRTGELTLHTKTAIAVCEQMTSAKFSVETLPDGATMVTCRGMGVASR